MFWTSHSFHFCLKCYSGRADGQHKLVINEIKPTKGNIQHPGLAKSNSKLFGGVKESWLADFSGKHGTTETSGDFFLFLKFYPVFMAIQIYKFEANKIYFQFPCSLYLCTSCAYLNPCTEMHQNWVQLELSIASSSLSASDDSRKIGQIVTVLNLG